MTTNFVERADGEQAIGALVFKPPTADTPGYLRTLRTAMQLQRMRVGDSLEADPELIDKLVEFLASYVVQPAERAAAKDALLDASKKQFDEMLSAVARANGTEENAKGDAIPLARSATSATS